MVRRSSWRQLTRQTKRHLRECVGPHVYAIYDSYDVCLYVGQTGCIPMRFDYEHAARFASDGPVTVRCIACDDTDTVEAYLIDLLGPTDNLISEIEYYDLDYVFPGFDREFIVQFA